MKKIYVLLIGIVFFASACESIEDTYNNFPSGTTRYVGKCSDLTVNPGWERVELHWTNSIDPTVKQIRVSWRTDAANVSDTLLAPDAETCNITDLENAVYTFEVCAMDDAGNTSIAAIGYARPYTYEHEGVIGFSRVVTKQFRVKNNVILFFDRWQTTMKEVTLRYYRNGKLQEEELTEEIVGKQYKMLRGIDTDMPVTIDRTGALADCPDEIVFPPLELDFSSRNFTNDFANMLKNRYQVNDVYNESFANSITELEVDYNLSSLEDLLYFPNLQKVILGKNRYMDKNYLVNVSNVGLSTVTEKEKSLYILDLANELAGVTVEQYNNHYFTAEDIAGKSYFKDMGNPELPEDLKCLQTDDWTVTATVEDETGFDTHMEFLLDDNPATIWRPQVSSLNVQTHELTIDMKEEKTFSGFKIAQKAFVSASDGDIAYLPAAINIQVSSNNIAYKIPLLSEENEIGNTPGEVTILKLKEPITARYIRIEINDVINFSQYNVLLGDFMVIE